MRREEKVNQRGNDLDSAPEAGTPDKHSPVPKTHDVGKSLRVNDRDGCSKTAEQQAKRKSRREEERDRVGGLSGLRREVRW